MAKLLDTYRKFVAQDTLEQILKLGDHLAGKVILHVHSESLRSGVTDMLDHLGALAQDVGLSHRSVTMVGTEEFFDFLRLSEEGSVHGVQTVPGAWKGFYEEAMRQNARRMFLAADLVVVHGLQPMGLVEHRRDGRPWLWRCHSDVSAASRGFWSFASRFAAQYQGAVFSHARFERPLRIPSFVIAPSVDPTGPVNQELTPGEIESVLDKLGIPMGRPLILQFLAEGSLRETLDAIRTWKTMGGLGRAVLVLVHTEQETGTAGTLPPADLEALASLDQNVRILSPGRASRELAALGWAAAAAIDASESKWPNLSLLDLMWKGKPVLVSSGSASAVLIDETSGFLMDPETDLARTLDDLLANPDVAEEMGDAARATVIDRYLAPRHLLDYLKLMLHFEKDFEGAAGGGGVR